MPPEKSDDMTTDTRQRQLSRETFGITMQACVLAAFVIILASTSWADDIEANKDPADTKLEATADAVEENIEEQIKKRDWMVVPVPVSSPTFGTGLVVGGAYFWPQTEEQKKAQPASVTGAAGFYSDYESSAFGIGHQGYWSGDKWRITVAAAAVDLNLNLQVAGGDGRGSSIDWHIEGGGFFGEVSRRIKGDWRVGVAARYIDVEQEFEPDLQNIDFEIANETRSAGLGANLEYDTRDDPYNAYKGNRFKFSILANSKSLGGDSSYESYDVLYASYHPVTPKVVVAWEAQACHRSDRTALWDACNIELRGFALTDYLGKSSASAQVEARWRFYRRWGAVAFTGGGYYRNALTENRDRELIPSYGIGLRFMVLESHRINLRLDYARSTDSDAFYLGVTETF